MTGSTAAIGLAIVKALAAEGADVVVNGRTQARVDAAITEVKTAVSNAKVRGITLDLSTKPGADERFCPACGGQCQVSALIYPHTCMCPKGHHWS